MRYFTRLAFFFFFVSKPPSSTTKIKKAASTVSECANCTTPESKIHPLSSCKRCRLVKYCSRACQVQHWKQGGHRRFCASPGERRVQAMVGGGVRPKQGDDSDDEICPVCIEELDVYATTNLPCSHTIHTDCMEDLRSFAKQNMCPLCRLDLPPVAPSAAPSAPTTTTFIEKCACCGVTKRESNRLLKCGRCKSVSYCTEACQKKHWKEGGHKSVCKQVVAEQDIASKQREVTLA